jgi:holin-like protein
MKILKQLSIILSVWALGEYASSLLKSLIVIPGSIMGMLILFILLNTKIIKLEKIEDVSDFFLKNIGIFFIPPGVGLLASWGIIKQNGLVILLTTVISTITVITVTGIVVDRLVLLKKKDNVNENVESPSKGIIEEGDYV